MDSQDSRQLNNDLKPMNASDSISSQHVFNSSQSDPQLFQTQANQLGPFNLPFQPNFTFNPMNVSYPLHTPQNFGQVNSYQELLYGSKAPFEIQMPSSTKGSTKKGKLSNGSDLSQNGVNSKNWSKDEDIALTKAWLYVSVDSDVGNNQKNSAMWERILQVWKERLGVYDEARTNNGLQCRWGKIMAAVNKFHGHYERLERTPRSGTTPEDMKREAVRMYENLNNGSSFKFEHCWELLKKNPKWCSKELTRTSDCRKQKVGNEKDNPPLSTPSTYSPEDEGINLDSPMTQGVASSQGLERPEGRKATKEKKRRLNEERGVADALHKLQATLELHLKEDLEQRKEKDKKDHELKEYAIKREFELKENAQKRREQERIINTDVSKLPLPLQKEIEMYQAEIMREWKENGYCGKHFGSSN